MVAQASMLSRLIPFRPAATELDWEALYARELPRVHNFFRYRVGPGPVAEDLASATFEKAWRSRDRYRRDLAGFSTWLFAIARNVAVDYYRRQREETPLEDAFALAPEAGPEAIAEHNADAARLSALLARLPERERELLAMKYGAEMTNRQIARLTGLSESNVGTLLYRAVAGLRARWDQPDRKE
jgi:RNA polymerase sigma-70 factor (ECF subfamily)